MSSDRVPGAVLPLLYLIAVLLLSAVGAWWAVRQERREPSAYTRRMSVAEAESRVAAGDVPSLEEWRHLDQVAWDDAALRAGAAAEERAQADAVEAAGARAVEDAARVNVLFRP